MERVERGPGGRELVEGWCPGRRKEHHPFGGRKGSRRVGEGLAEVTHQRRTEIFTLLNSLFLRGVDFASQGVCPQSPRSMQFCFPGP